MTLFDRMFNGMRKPWVILVFLVLVVLSFIYVDRPLATYFHQMDLRTNRHWLYWVTALGQWKIDVLILVFVGLYFRFVAKNLRYERNTWFLLSCILAVNLINCVLKIALGRARPELLFSSNEYGLYWLQLKDAYWSMPSGHAATSTALAAGLGVLIPEYVIGFLFLAFFVCATRVLLYYHYLSDVLTGFYMSVIVVGIIALYFKKNRSLG
ncbi:MAG: phosphatase PAP2 family protein [Legionellales bacterium]